MLIRLPASDSRVHSLTIVSGSLSTKSQKAESASRRSCQSSGSFPHCWRSPCNQVRTVPKSVTGLEGTG
jgi:hypothetical protein